MELWAELTTDQKLTVFVAAGSAILGGTVSLATSWLMARQGNKHQETMRANDKVDLAVARAQETFVKLLQYANAAYSMKSVIDVQFDHAGEEGHGDLEPVNKVQEIVAVETDLEAFSASEMAFLLHSDDAELLGDLLVYEKRVLAAIHSIHVYNEMRRELTTRIEAGTLKSGSGTTGTVFSSELVGKEALLADVRVAALNKLLGEIMEKLDREVISGREHLTRYQSAAIKAFGNLYPKLQFEEPTC